MKSPGRDLRCTATERGEAAIGLRQPVPQSSGTRPLVADHQDW